MNDTYDIELKVPLGIRHGVLRFQRQEENCMEGTIEILGNSTTFTGTRNGEKIQISGELKTCIRKITYQGQGSLADGSIQLQLKSGRSTYILTGIRRPVIRE